MPGMCIINGLAINGLAVGASLMLIEFEEILLRDPKSLKGWISYLDKCEEKDKIKIYERAISNIPGSFKLWKRYLDYRLRRLLEFPDQPPKSNAKYAVIHKIKDLLNYKVIIPFDDPEWRITEVLFQKALVFCHKFPITWAMYAVFLIKQDHFITKTRRVLDSCLQALPLTQHPMIWILYLEFAEKVAGETCVRIWKRYLKIEPDALEDYVDILLDMDPPRPSEAAKVLARVLSTPGNLNESLIKGYKSTSGKSNFQLWSHLADLVTEYPDEMEQSVILKGGKLESLDVDTILRAGISRFTDQVGKIWNSLARWWILKGEWEKARDIYEEALASVVTLRDFSLVFDTYAKTEEDILAAQMDALDSGSQDIEEFEVDMGLARFERLMERRPFMLNEVLLRQNPHNVAEWKSRVLLWDSKGNKAQVNETYNTALATIDCKKAVGSLPALWIDFAHFSLKEFGIEAARDVYEKAVTSRFKNVDDLVDIWCAYAEMELEAGEEKRASDLLSRACTPPKGLSSFVQSIRYDDEKKDPLQRVFKSLKLWSLYVDIEEAIGTIESTKAVYDRIIELKIALPETILNYASFLEEKNFFEESFRVYERGIDVFGYPVAFDIWNVYLNKFIARYKGTKMERARDLFEHALENVPANVAKSIFLRYAKLEEDYGLARRAMSIYDRAVNIVSEEDRIKIFEIYIAKAASFFGLSATRDIYAKAIEILPDNECRKVCLEFASTEIKLGEIDRARAIYIHGSQMADPEINPDYWKIWSDFEVKYGNEETFKEMLRVKRSVQAKYSSQAAYMSAKLLAASRAGQELPSVPSVPSEADKPKSMADLEAMVIAEQESQALPGFVRATVTEPKKETPNDNLPGQQESNTNPDEIALDESDDDIETVAVPAAVFGGLKRKSEE